MPETHAWTAIFGLSLPRGSSNWSVPVLRLDRGSNRRKLTSNNVWNGGQGVEHFKDIQYNERSKYGEILMQQEYEMSCFNLEEANIEIYQQLYDLYGKVGHLFHED
jgi:hypothetical protein